MGRGGRIMNIIEDRKQTIGIIVKDRMNEYGINYTEEQLENMIDFVNGLVTLALKIQEDMVLSKLERK